VDAPSAAHGGLPIAQGIPCETDAGIVTAAIAAKYLAEIAGEGALQTRNEVCAAGHAEGTLAGRRIRGGGGAGDEVGRLEGGKDSWIHVLRLAVDLLAIAYKEAKVAVQGNLPQAKDIALAFARGQCEVRISGQCLKHGRGRAQG